MRIEQTVRSAVAGAVGLALGGLAAVQRCVVPVAARSQPSAMLRIEDARRPAVALTIDDGPSARTAEVLDLLAEHGATATFFVHTDHIDATPGGEASVRRILRDGHELGNHMPSDTPSIALSDEAFAAAFAESDARLRGLGALPRLFRPAGGAYSRKKMDAVLARHGYEPRYVLGSYLPWDVAIPLPERYADHLAGLAYPGAILVLHDGDHTGPARIERTLTTLRRLLRRLTERGYAARSIADARAAQL